MQFIDDKTFIDGRNGMKIDKNITKVICEIEYKIGNETYNPNSYNGWTCEEGCEFRYPVNYCRNRKDVEDQYLTRTKGIIQNISSDCIDTIKYKFGSNHLYVGNGIVKALEYLENRYNIDFNKLEEERIKILLEKMHKMEQDLNDGKTITISKRKWIAGLDIPTGTYDLVIDDEDIRYIRTYIEDENGLIIWSPIEAKNYTVTLKDNYTFVVFENWKLHKSNQ